MKKYLVPILIVGLVAASVTAVVTRPKSQDSLAPYKHQSAVNHRDAAALVERINNACNDHREGKTVYHGHTVDWTIGDDISGRIAPGTVKVTCEQNHSMSDYKYATWITAVSQ